MNCPESSTSGITPTLELERNRCEGCSSRVDATRNWPRVRRPHNCTRYRATPGYYRNRARNPRIEMSDGGLLLGRLLHVSAKPGADSLPIEVTLTRERDDDLVVLK
jgi:hypothetical protein